MVKAMKAVTTKTVQKKKALSTLCPTSTKDIKKDLTTKNAVTKKIRVGILVGKDFDPVKKGTHWPKFPKELILTDSDWGKYSIDAATAIKLQQLHPDLLEVDIIPGKQVSEKRLKQNHVNINYWYEVGVAMLSNDKKHVAEVTKCHKNPDCRLDPSWDYYDWVLCKPRYMKQCIKAGIPMIPTVMYEDGFDPKQCMKDVQKMLGQVLCEGRAFHIFWQRGHQWQDGGLPRSQGQGVGSVRQGKQEFKSFPLAALHIETQWRGL